MSRWFGLTLFANAALVFLVQPMVAKGLLPVLGGAPSVWATCLVFFQAALLAGYAYAHATSAWLGVRRQAVVHLGLLTLAALALPLDPLPRTVPASGEGLWGPSAWLLGWLAVTVGLPFIALAAGAPMLQRWFSASGHPEADDPYFLYGASNLGSLLALLAYPFVVEPFLPLAGQGRLWSVGYFSVGLLVASCAAVVWRSGKAARRVEVWEAIPPSAPAREWPRWVALAFVPSSLMMGVTSFLTTDVAAVPLLWVVPLALYLLTFIDAFSRRPIVPRGLSARLLPWAVLGLVPSLGMGIPWPLGLWLAWHLVTFFLAARLCHGALADDRPGPSRLTGYYLAISFGGALGGVFNALVAPLVFDRIVEYPLALVLACLVLPGAGPRTVRQRVGDVLVPAALFALTAVLVTDWRGVSETAVGVVLLMTACGGFALVVAGHRRRPLRFALTVGAAWLALGMSGGGHERTLRRERSFFGVSRVTFDPATDTVALYHGTTLHGRQSHEPTRRREPLTYFHRDGPVGPVFEAFQRGGAQPSVAVVGLGAGTLACFAVPGQSWTFYEIDPAVVRIAEDARLFTFLKDCRADRLSVIPGDARLRLREAPPKGYGLIVLDAFSSDAMPVHLMTREALALYLSKLSDHGLIACNISNRSFDLRPVLGALARVAGLVCLVRSDLTRDDRTGKMPSAWAVLARSPADLGPLARDSRWEEPPLRPGMRVWTDQAANPLGALR